MQKRKRINKSIKTEKETVHEGKGDIKYMYI